MTDPLAVLVEDDPQQAAFSTKVLEAARFIVKRFDSIAPAMEFLRSTNDLIDLFVLDRRLPMRLGEPATDELGDALLEEIRLSFPDSRLIIFTGFATIRHVQRSVQGGGQLPAQGEDPIDRVTVLQKDQSIEFKESVEDFRALLQRLDDIELQFASGSKEAHVRDRRVLRRVAFELRAVSVLATPLAGGLTGAGVWRCDFVRLEGPIASVVVKRVKKLIPPGGLPELLPRENTTATVATLSGLIGGGYVNVLHLAGVAPVALMAMIEPQPLEAMRHADNIDRALASISGRRQTLSLAEICRPLIDWSQLTRALAEFDVVVPLGTLMASVSLGMRHCDLHPANILIDNDNAVLIDFDSSEYASAGIDPITLLLSTLVHPDSPLRGDAWPSPDSIAASYGTSQFGLDSDYSDWLSSAMGRVLDRKSSDREFWALTLAYAGRQLQYDDVKADSETTERLVALARLAVDKIATT